MVHAPTSGTLTRLDAMAVGLAAWRLGAGRARKEDAVQAGAGVVWHARPGDAVRESEPLFTLHSDDADRWNALKHDWSWERQEQTLLDVYRGLVGQSR